MRVFRLILLVLFSAQVVLAQETAPEPRELPAEIAAGFDERRDEIDARKKIVDQLAERLEKSEGIFADVIGARMDAVWTKMFDDTVTLARDVAAEHNDGFEVSALIDVLTEDLRVFPERAVETIERLRADVVFPTDDLEPHEIVIADQQLLNAIQKVDSVLASLITYLAIAGTLELDKSVERSYLIEALEDSAANRSVFLELALENVAVMRAAVTALPSDTAMISLAAVTEARVKVASQSLQEMIRLMVQMKLEVSQYRQQVLTATGELTADVLDVSVIAGLIAEWSKFLARLAVTWRCR